MAGEDDWRVSCSDEERSPSRTTDASGKSRWEPKPEEIIELYTDLSKKGALSLEWHCPGRRSPSVHSSESGGADRRAIEEDEAKTVEPNEFDFDDEGMEPKCSPKITPRRRTTPSSTQKRIAKFDKVMFDVRRQRELDAIEKVGHHHSNSEKR
uniref:Putative paxip1-associated protein n=1 Tax=Ixodes ricinus TaxID=34613 RepID=A0A0K8R3J1_IXORI